MGAAFHRDDRVRLQKGIAAVLTKKAFKANNHKRVDWRTREGTIVRVSITADSIGVLWDDRASIDQWPTAALEKIDERSRTT
jgi:ribosomal protein L28